MTINRRELLKNGALLSLGVAFAGVFRSAAAQTGKAAFGALCDRWTDILTGRKNIDPNNPAYQAALTALNSKVDKTLRDVNPTPNGKSVFTSIDLSSNKSAALTKTARATETLALGWATPGCSYYQNPKVLQAAIDTLQQFLILRYHPGQTEYGNWWDWESGAARAVGDTMCILHQKLPPAVLQAAANGLNYFVPDPWFLRTQNTGGSSTGASRKTPSTGANRLDLCRASLCGAAATGDKARLQRALAGLGETWAFVDKDDGFYRDGSFIQHHHVPYTGSYGDVLLDGLSKLFTLVSNSDFNIPAAERKKVYALVDHAFLPVMVEGQVLDFVRGRSVSRMNESAAGHGKSIIRAILQLSVGAPPEIAQRWRGTVRGWVERNPYDKLTDSKSLPEIALFSTLQSARALPADSKPKMFPAMDRLVHRSPHGWTMGIALCSPRIAWYECGNGENEWASRTGSGMRYLLLPHDMGQYENGFWPTLDYSAPPGTTVDQHPLARKVAGEWGNATPPSEWAGGLTHGQYSVAAMHLLSPDNNGLAARRLWLGLPEMMVEAVSDVQSPATPALTVVEHRNLGEKDQQTLLIDGKTITNSTTVTNPRWAHLAHVAGYVFLTPATLTGQKETRHGSWLNINPARKLPNAGDELTRHWATLHFDHANHPAGAWLIVPNADAQKTAQLAQKPPVRVLRNDAAAQILATANLVAGAAWRAGQYGDYALDRPALFLWQSHSGKNALSVSDPSQQAPKITLTLAKKYRLATKNPRVAARIVGNKTELTFTTKGLAGQAIHCDLMPA